MYKNKREVDKAKYLLFCMRNLDTLLMLCGVFPMLYEMNLMIKLAQERHIYIIDLFQMRK